jgi:pimeloyl-ACP methyl ester carboxylesterase
MRDGRAIVTGMTRRGVVAGVALAAVVVAGCSSTGRAGTGVQDEKNVSLKKDCASAACAGTRGGAKYQIKLPASKKKWNGTLVIYSHGYRNAVPIPTNPLVPSQGESAVDTSAESAPSATVASQLTGQGYALAGSSFKTNGWDVLDGVAGDKDLYSYFSATFGTPKRVYIWGVSLGGLITETLAESHPSWVSGVAPLCGVLGGTNLNLDLALDVAFMVKTLIYPKLTLTGFTSSTQAVAEWRAASQAVYAKAKSATPEAIADLFAIAAVSGAPAQTLHYDGSTATSIGGAYVEGIVTALGYGTWGRYDIEQRAGGNPSQNARVDYQARIGAAATATINSLAPGQLPAVLAKLSAAPRVSANPAARAKAATFGNPTGAITVPTVTMHTIDDPLVISPNETVFASRVGAHNQSTLLKQIFTAPPAKYKVAPYGAGHCNFTKDEAVGVITVLDKWVRGDEYPSPGIVATAFGYNQASTPAEETAGTAKTGYVPTLGAAAWPAKITS